MTSFDLNEAIDVYDSMTFMILSHKCSVVVVKVWNTIKVSVPEVAKIGLCSKICEKSLN